MYKVLALDLDGTVLTDDQSIHSEVKQAIIEARKHCKVVIATGRHHTAAKAYYYDLKLDTPIICCNGAYAYDYQTERVISANAISQSEALTFIELAKEFQMKLVMFATDEMTYSKQNPAAYMKALESWSQQYPVSLKPQICGVESFTDSVRQSQYIWKFVAEGSPSSVERLSALEWVQNHFSCEYAWSNRVVFFAKDNSKGHRLNTYVNSLGYCDFHVMAIGDNDSDISMIDYAALGIAMKHADDGVKSHAKIICSTDNNGAGLAQLIREHIKG
ncbi:Cof-type HAD-IIB family hydrolase [Vibrio salinus]|uniref:Cof-type HAD-IIB family hydrolase n=1 Tax=Vibrio salinus TaxID=2899784 RepID=UPI001E5EE83B|nr:Cof-type HAD-IIB family hydrolase [Vibrio salinus]MCE0494506.1 Cof-type HAD-IIB family hydrolase [Vibrio salinus]